MYTENKKKLQIKPQLYSIFENKPFKGSHIIIFLFAELLQIKSFPIN